MPDFTGQVTKIEATVPDPDTGDYNCRMEWEGGVTGPNFIDATLNTHTALLDQVNPLLEGLEEGTISAI